MKKKKKSAMEASNAVGTARSRGGCGRKEANYGNYRIPDTQYQKELELTRRGVNLLEESRRHG